MKKLKTTLFFILFLASASLAGQISRGDRYYSSGKFADAIPAYERGLRSKSDAQAMENLANCYRITKNYQKAEEWYSKTISTNPSCNPMVYFYYGVVLRTNGKNAEAKKQFQHYISTYPSDKKAQAEIDAIGKVDAWLTQTPLYEVSDVTSINTPVSDISPVFYNNGLLFVSDRGQTDLLNDNNAPVTNRAFYSVYYAKKTFEKDDSVVFGKAKKLPRVINGDYHNGPVSVTEDGKLMAFNRVSGKLRSHSKHFVNRPKIYFSERNGKHWSKPQPFPFNSDDYSCAHPALSPDGTTLYFCSDMPGGQGGKDIWVSHKDANGWSKPENLGPEVNTPGDEVFPFIRKDGMLFFSSDGHPGFGGLDIFSAMKDKNGKWGNVANQGAPLNSPMDDFAVIFNSDESRGFFTSNRAGGKGDDDVYSFKVTAKFVRISGKLLSSKNTGDVVPNAKLEVLTKDGTSVRKGTSDAQGNFDFESLPADQTYIVRLDENDPGIAAKSKYYMTDDNNKLVRVTTVDDAGGKYTFHDLPADPAAPPELLSDDDYLTLAGNLISDSSPPQAYANTTVSLKDGSGNVLQTATTNEFGAFTFSHIPPDKTYVISVDGIDDPKLSGASKVIITNKSGKELMSAKPDAKGNFSFRILAEDQSTINALTVTDTDLRLDMHGTLTGADSARTVLANTKIDVVDAKGNVVQSATTDDKGNFDFKNLPADQAYIMSVGNVNDPSLVSMGKIYIRDENGKIIKVLRVASNGKFEFRVLPLDRTTLGSVYVDDPWLQALQMKAAKQQNDSLLIIENIYYDYGDWHILPAGEITLEKVVKVMQTDPSIMIEVSSHTDSRSSADFNLRLSQKRADEVKRYLVKRGVDAKRITAIGYGETRLLNRCKDGVDCSEAEHAVNRRTEFRLKRKNN